MAEGGEGKKGGLEGSKDESKRRKECRTPPGIGSTGGRVSSVGLNDRELQPTSAPPPICSLSAGAPLLAWGAAHHNEARAKRPSHCTSTDEMRGPAGSSSTVEATMHATDSFPLEKRVGCHPRNTVS